MEAAWGCKLETNQILIDHNKKIYLALPLPWFRKGFPLPLTSREAAWGCNLETYIFFSFLLGLWRPYLCTGPTSWPIDVCSGLHGLLDICSDLHGLLDVRGSLVGIWGCLHSLLDDCSFLHGILDVCSSLLDIWGIFYGLLKIHGGLHGHFDARGAFVCQF